MKDTIKLNRNIFDTRSLSIDKRLDLKHQIDVHVICTCMLII